MLAQPPYPENNPAEYWSTDELVADLARLEATLDRADVLVAEALRPEPVDWERHYTVLFAEAAADGRRRAARMESRA